ncbi:MAG: hypothetical protein ACLRSW_12235 [Christensenellaceae bacterium]
MDTTADETCWFEWISVALYSIEYLKQRGTFLGSAWWEYGRAEIA